MELTTSQTPAALAWPRRLTAHLDAPAVAAWTLGFAVVAYLALSNGGYDTVVRSQVGIAVWWIVLLGALAGILPARLGAAGWTAIGLLAGFALWTAIATGWSESAERSTIELGRVAAYLGVLVLALAVQGRAVARHTINGLACAIGFVTILAVLSRLHPQWFPANDHFEFFGPDIARKLSYPLNYWNALAALTAMGVPLLLAVVLNARTLAGQAAAAAALPVSALCVYLTVSRGGSLALAVGIVVFLAFVPRRLDALGTLLVAGAGAALLVAAASQRDALQTAIPTSAASQEGTDLLWMALIVCTGVGLLQVAIGLARRHVARPALLEPTRRAVVWGTLAVAIGACGVAVAAGAPSWAADRWAEFKAPWSPVTAQASEDVFSRLSGANGTGRYQMWQSGLEAHATDPWRGIGPGTFEFWWARDAPASQFVRDAHSLYIETLAESGIVGLVLLGGLLAFLLVAAIARSLRAAPALRIWIAGAAGALAAFMTSAAFEWVWEMGAIACAVMVLAAVIVAGRESGADIDVGKPSPRRVAPRALLALLAVASLGAVAVPMAGALATRDSRDAVAEGNLAAALEESRTAERLQPYAATAHLQRALVLEQTGNLAGAAVAAKAATTDEPTNWRTWFVLARIDARRGEPVAAVHALRKAQRLNRRSPLVNGR